MSASSADCRVVHHGLMGVIWAAGHGANTRSTSAAIDSVASQPCRSTSTITPISGPSWPPTPPYRRLRCTVSATIHRSDGATASVTRHRSYAVPPPATCGGDDPHHRAVGIEAAIQCFVLPFDPQDRTRFFYKGLEFQLDWQTGTDRLVRVFRGPIRCCTRITAITRPTRRSIPPGPRARVISRVATRTIRPAATTLLSSGWMASSRPGWLPPWAMRIRGRFARGGIPQPLAARYETRR